MLVEKNVPLQAFNTFRIVAKAHALARIGGEADVQALLADPTWGPSPTFVLGGGSTLRERMVQRERERIERAQSGR